MDSLWSSRDAAEPPKADADVSDAQAAAGPVPTASDPSPQTHKLPIRPPIRRDELQAPPPPAPAPPSSAPGPGPGQGPGQPPQPTDSLSLMQLRRIVAEFKQPDIVAYDFVYADVAPHAEEIDEWFVYQFWQWVRLNGTQRAFEWHWQQEYHTSWEEASLGVREAFVREAVQGIKAAETSKRLSAIQRLFYVVLGRWSDSASAETLKPGSRCAASASQLAAIKEGVIFLTRQNGIETVWKALQDSFEGFWSDDFVAHGTTLQEAMDEFTNLMTILYICIQQTLDDRIDMAETQRRLLALNPSLVDFLLSATSKLRWDEAGTIPQAPIFLLFWKSILLVFGGSDEIKEAKAALRETDNDSKDPTRITASPLDYHVFRQEITSKYPAYIPPQPLIPLEADQSSLLPPIPNNPTRNNNGANGILPAPASNQSGGGASILHQPVHIATPAPSPPPSPGVGGKGGKKQNYQTNQNFPFMYPPLDANSNSAGGKGGAGLQMLLVGRKWEGSDVPKSIAEAGDLFSQRVRMTRATRQLWEERERFLKSERGWDAPDASDDEIEDLDLNGLTKEEREEIDKFRAENRRETARIPKPEIDYGPHQEEVSGAVKARLEAVEKFYENSLPQLQSMVIVLLKAILMNVTAIMTQAQAAQQHPGAAGRGNAPNGTPASARPQDGSGSAVESPEQTPEEVDAARTREITAKAVTGILLLLLKWLKISHVLKFEYLTQLLLDSNYLPLVLKLFAHQDIQQVVDSKTDRIENSFFHFCNLRAAAKHNKPSSSPPPPPPPLPAVEPEVEDEESEDEAAPPPIKRRRSPQGPKPQDGDSSKAGEGAEAGSQQQPAARPEVDELGYPVNVLPKEPITDFSQRNFFSLINYLRIMQKICKNKAHRNLLLVQYKSGNILRKSLKVPQPELRLYTLKLFKNQVPYWGRKWRQSNMRVITAVYLYCRPELRDEWLAGSDVDAEVDAAVPLEQALRSLTHWFNVRRYPDKIAEEVRHALKDEQGFFVRELEKIDLSWPEAGPEESVSGEWEYEAATN